MNQAYLKNILSAKFDFDIWKDLLEKIFPKVEVFTSVAKIADSHVKDGGHVGNIRLDDGRSLAIFRLKLPTMCKYHATVKVYAILLLSM